MRKIKILLTIETAEPIFTPPDLIANIVSDILKPQIADVSAVRVRDRETLIKYADPESMHRVEPDAGKTWTEKCKEVSALAKMIRADGSSVRVVKITADGFFDWLGKRSNTEETRKEYADWVAEHRTRTITEARREASRENGKRGGRPRKIEKSEKRGIL